MPAPAAENIPVESIFNHVNEGIVVTDSKGVILLANPAALRQFGYDAAELKGRPVEILIPDNLRAPHHDHRKGYHQHPETRQMGVGRDLQACRKDGAVFPVEISLSPFTANGKPYVAAFIIDITQRKKNEQVILEKQQALEAAGRLLKSSNELLEKKVNDRTQVLREALNALEKSKAELSEALEKEKELNELKSRFLSMASHEFRTPLTAILSSAGLIGEYPETGQQDKRMKHVDRIKSAVGNLTDILGDFLSLSRIEEGKINVVHAPFDFNELLEDVCNELRATAKPGQRLACTFSGDAHLVLDGKLLRHILVNLLSNAVKYSDEGKEVRLAAAHRPGMLEVTVSDEGIGIPAEDQQHLFERFFRGENATHIQGTGLGLNIVANYVELLGGVITFESELGRGSEFRVRIPLKAK